MTPAQRLILIKLVEGEIEYLYGDTDPDDWMHPDDIKYKAELEDVLRTLKAGKTT